MSLDQDHEWNDRSQSDSFDPTRTEIQSQTEENTVKIGSSVTRRPQTQSIITQSHPPSPSFAQVSYCYFFATIATLIKTVAWWFNQWPATDGWNFGAKWAASAGIAGCEYLPMTFAMQSAVKFGVHLSVMTAYMEASDNGFRMLQQVALSKPLGWYDWLAAIGLIVIVAVQAYLHYDAHRRQGKGEVVSGGRASPDVATGESADQWPAISGEGRDPELSNHGGQEAEMTHLAAVSDGMDPAESSPSAVHSTKEGALQYSALSTPGSGITLPSSIQRFQSTPRLVKIIVFGTLGALILIIACAAGGNSGRAYSLATLATLAKTFAWWINQYPRVSKLPFLAKWLCGWSIAAALEYIPLLGAFTLATQYTPHVHLGLMTAMMEALDNVLRIGQQWMLQKPLYTFDYTCAGAMVLCVIFQGIMSYALTGGT